MKLKFYNHGLYIFISKHFESKNSFIFEESCKKFNDFLDLNCLEATVIKLLYDYDKLNLIFGSFFF